MINRLIKIAGWVSLWLLLFWVFLVTGFPAETARDWLAERLGKEISARVSIEELRINWDLDVKIKGISIIRGQAPSALSLQPSAFSVQLASLDIRPKLLSLIRLKPALDFSGRTPSNGIISGSYDPAELSISFKDISFKDITISTLPVPSGTTAAGSGRFKLLKGKGMVEIEVEGVPGGKQKLTASGGQSPGLDGKVKVAVSLPKL
ncbi:MAG: type II secretion system protein GspN [Deltaproteobacteria bacterium]|nr:type II secretion system protein GspN [Deltaproteobacteria bacterium]